jgi:hypothetical protein
VVVSKYREVLKKLTNIITSLDVYMSTLKSEFNNILYKSFILTSQRMHCLLITKVDMLRENIAVDNNTICGQNANISILKVSVAPNHH